MHKKILFFCQPTFLLTKLILLSLSENYLNSEASPDEDILGILGYNIIRNDHDVTLNVGEFVFITKTHCLLN